MKNAVTAVRRYLEARLGEEIEPQVWKRLADLCRRTGDWRGEVSALVEMCAAPDLPLRELTETAARLTGLGEPPDSPSEEIAIWMRQLADLLEPRATAESVSAADCGALAQLYWHLRDAERSRFWARQGLALDGADPTCLAVEGKALGNSHPIP